MRKILVLLFVALLGLTMATGAQAATATSNLTVQATIGCPPTCTLNSPPVNFGVVALGTLPLNRTGTVTMNCACFPAVTTKVVGICRGANFDGSWRRMRRISPSSLNFQRYGIFKGLTGIAEWGGQNCNLQGTYPFGTTNNVVFSNGAFSLPYNVDFIGPAATLTGLYSDVALVEVDY